MIIECGAGTPNHLEVETFPTPVRAKGFFNTRLKARRKWADRYNVAAGLKLASIHEEISSINFLILPVGETRRWSVTDDVSGVVMMFTIRVVSQ